MERDDCYTLAEAAEILGVGERRASRKRLALRMALFLILLLMGVASLIAGLSWDAALSALAADLIRSQNVLDLIHPDHSPLIDGIIAFIGSLGQILATLGVAVIVVALAGAAYSYLRYKGYRGNTRWLSPGFRRLFVTGSGALVVLAAGITIWATGGLSYEDRLAAEGSNGTSSDPTQESALQSAVNLFASARGAQAGSGLTEQAREKAQSEQDNATKQAQDRANDASRQAQEEADKLREKLEGGLSPPK